MSRARGYCWALLLALLWTCGMPGLLAAQTEKGGSIRRLRVTSVTPKKVSGRWELSISGDCARIPAGTKVEFVLIYRGLKVETFPVTLPAGDRFTVKHSLEKARATTGALRLRSTILRDGQSATVRAAMNADPEFFPKDQKQWVDYHFESPIRLGTPEDLDALHERVVQYFGKRWEELVLLDKAVAAAVKQAKAGDKKYTRDDKFSADKWHDAFAEEFLEPLADIQARIQEGFKDVELYNYRRPLSDLQEIALAVARRTLHRQELLFESLDVELEDEYRNPEDVDVAAAMRVVDVKNAEYLVRKWNAIAAALGIATTTDEDEKGSGEQQPEESSAKKAGQE